MIASLKAGIPVIFAVTPFPPRLFPFLIATLSALIHFTILCPENTSFFVLKTHKRCPDSLDFHKFCSDRRDCQIIQYVPIATPLDFWE